MKKNSNVVNISGITISYANPKEMIAKDSITPMKVIYNPPYTICYFEDDTKEIVKCMDGEEFSEEAGVMACITKRVVKNHSFFMRLVKNGYHQPRQENDKEETQRIRTVGRKDLTKIKGIIL